MNNIQQLSNKFFAKFTDNKRVESLKRKLSNVPNDLETFYPSLEFEQYLIYEEKFEQAKAEFDKLNEMSTKGNIRSRLELNVSKNLHQTLIKNALSSWITLGFKYEIEKIIIEAV